MKVCKLVRLTKKDGKGEFVPGEGEIVMRPRAVVTDDAVAESEANYSSTGLLYVVDVEATAERDAKKAVKNAVVIGEAVTEEPKTAIVEEVVTEEPKTTIVEEVVTEEPKATKKGDAPASKV